MDISKYRLTGNTQALLILSGCSQCTMCIDYVSGESTS